MKNVKPQPSPFPTGSIVQVAAAVAFEFLTLFLTLSLLIPARVICWQSYSSILSRLWQLFRCSREASVIRGQLSSSITSKRSWAQAPLPKCRIPSSVISSQWDKLCGQTQRVSGQTAANTLPGDTGTGERTPHVP